MSRSCFVKYDKQTSLLEVKCSFYATKLVKDVGPLSWSPEKGCWLFGFTLYNIVNLQLKFGVLGADDETIKVIGELEQCDSDIEKIVSVDRACRSDGLFGRLNVKCDDGIFLHIPAFKGKLRGFQRRGVAFAIRRKTALLCDEMGLGKTAEGIAYALGLKQYCGAKTCLVVVLSGIKYNWRNEIEKFYGKDYVIIDGTSEARKKKWKKKAFFKVVSYDTAIADLGLRKKPKGGNTEEIMPRKFDVVVVDEVHKIKHRKSVRSRALKAIEAEFRLGLTGTPLDGMLEELHSIMEFVEPGVFPSKAEFNRKFCITDRFNKILKYCNLEGVRERLKGYYVRRTKEQVAPELPEKVVSIITVELSPKERALYEKYKEEALNSDDVGKLALITRFKQICDSPEIIGEGIESSKLKVFIELLHEIFLSGRRAIIFSQYEEMCKLIMVAIEGQGYSTLHIYGGVESKRRQEIVEEFTADAGIAALVCTDAGSHGLNVQAADYVIHYDDSWSPVTMSQREDRSHRIGRKDVTNVIRFRTIDTVEERVVKVLEKKQDLQNILGFGDEAVMKKMSLKDLKQLI